MLSKVMTVFGHTRDLVLVAAIATAGIEMTLQDDWHVSVIIILTLILIGKEESERG